MLRFYSVNQCLLIVYDEIISLKNFQEIKLYPRLGVLIVVLQLLVGEVQKEKAAEILGLHPCGFSPQHSSKLGNEFRMFSNYDLGMRLGGQGDAILFALCFCYFVFFLFTSFTWELVFSYYLNSKLTYVIRYNVSVGVC